MHRNRTRRERPPAAPIEGRGPANIGYADINRDDLWADLLARAVAEPGTVSKAYRAFHRFSLCNQILALVECEDRGIDPGPLATYNGWQVKGRQVRRGEKAIALWMPLTGKRTDEPPDEHGDRPTSVRFVMTPKWFVASQTDPIEDAPIEPDEPPDWNVALALATLGVRPVKFAATDGNLQGYSDPKQRTLAINPVAPDPRKTTFHELGHILLHPEVDAAAYHAEAAVRSQVEVEAEGVVVLCLDALGLPGAEEARGYIQWWARAGRLDRPFDGPTARRIMKAAGAILGAGTIDGRGGDDDVDRGGIE